MPLPKFSGFIVRVALVVRVLIVKLLLLLNLSSFPYISVDPQPLIIPLSLIISILRLQISWVLQRILLELLPVHPLQHFGLLLRWEKLLIVIII